MNRKVAFLDRDGVINVDTGYVYRPQDYVWMPGAAAAIGLLNKQGYDVVIITNQSGIARGYYSEEQYADLATWIETKLEEEGAHVLKTLYCPHHSTEGKGPYLVDCACRKPKPGMINEVLTSGDYMREQCLLIGDKESDLLAADAAGIKGFQFTGDNLESFVKDLLRS